MLEKLGLVSEIAGTCIRLPLTDSEQETAISISKSKTKKAGLLGKLNL
jgi:hypothetical protein